MHRCAALKGARCLAPSPLCLNTYRAPLPYTRRPAVQRTALLAAEEGTSAGLDGVPDVAEATREAVTGGPPPPPPGASEEDREAVRLMTTPVTYNYAFFHLIFALASMYIAMLMTGWGSVAQVGMGRGVGGRAGARTGAMVRDYRRLGPPQWRGAPTAPA